MPHVYTDETLALIEQAKADIAAEQAQAADAAHTENGDQQ